MNALIEELVAAIVGGLAGPTVGEKVEEDSTVGGGVPFHRDDVVVLVYEQADASERARPLPIQAVRNADPKPLGF